MTVVVALNIKLLLRIKMCPPVTFKLLDLSSFDINEKLSLPLTFQFKNIQSITCADLYDFEYFKNYGLKFKQVQIT